MIGFTIINTAISVIFAICYCYQVVYTVVPWFVKKPYKHEPAKLGTFAVMICARNEESVIGNLIASIRHQTYPADKVTIFVMADNCTDQTAEIAASMGAQVYTRFNQTQIGKGYALDELLHHMQEDYPAGFDAYLIIDADNLLCEDFIENMNLMLDKGEDICTCYRNSKNYGDNWISEGYALWFLHEARYLNEARYLLNCSCAVSGTGFMFSRKIAEEMNGWPYHLLTEDVQFTMDQVAKGRKIAYCDGAELYDEQPTDFRVSMVQRLRWAKGNLQVFMHYCRPLLKGIFHGSFSCYDMLLATMPAYFLSCIAVFGNVLLALYYLIMGYHLLPILLIILQSVASAYFMFLVTGAIPAITEWKRIHTTPVRKILSVLTFPAYMVTYIPLTIVSLFSKPSWEPIKHKVLIGNIDEVR